MVTRREQMELIGTALFPAAVGMLKGPVSSAGHFAWLAPVLALPLGLLLSRLWRQVGTGGLPLALERGFGPAGGEVTQGIYLVWGLLLLAHTAQSCTARLAAAAQLRQGETAISLTALVLTIWLSAKPGRFVRTGRIFYLSTAVTLMLVGLLTLPSLRWSQLLPVRAEEWSGLPGGMLWSLSLAGYAAYGLCLPTTASGGSGKKPVIWMTLGLSGVLLSAVGALGAALTLRLDQPFLYILKGIGVPGAFQRGEAVLSAVLSLADLVLLGILTGGIAAIWNRWFPHGEKGGLVLAGLALAVSCFSKGRGAPGVDRFLAAGNLIVGYVIPIWTARRCEKRKHMEDKGISCGERAQS